MIIGGLEKMTLMDYPEKLAAVVFTKGCNFRCRFCYNPLLVWPDKEADAKKYEKTYSLIPEDEFFLFLESRRGKLDGIVISGGEPTLQLDLPDFIKKIKSMGYQVKLDTNGTNPKVLSSLLADNLLDYIAMDLKAPLTKYEKIVGVKVNCQNLEKSVKMIINSGLPHEFRTTVVPGLHEVSDFVAMGGTITGAAAWYLQKFKSDTPLVDHSWEKKPAFSSAEMEQMAAVGRNYVKKCEVR